MEEDIKNEVLTWSVLSGSLDVVHFTALSRTTGMCICCSRCARELSHRMKGHVALKAVAKRSRELCSDCSVTWAPEHRPWTKTRQLRPSGRPRRLAHQTGRFRDGDRPPAWIFPAPRQVWHAGVHGTVRARVRTGRSSMTSQMRALRSLVCVCARAGARAPLRPVATRTHPLARLRCMRVQRRAARRGLVPRV